MEPSADKKMSVKEKIVTYGIEKKNLLRIGRFRLMCIKKTYFIGLYSLFFYKNVLSPDLR